MGGRRWKKKRARRSSKITGHRYLRQTSWPKYRIEKNLPYGNGARSSPPSVPIFVRDVGECIEV